MNTEREQVGWSFAIWWVLASFVGWEVGYGMSGSVAAVVGEVLSIS